MTELSPKPNLEQLKKQAKDLLKAHKASNPEAVKRIQTHLPRLARLLERDILRAKFTLQDAQHIIAREQGFRNWRELYAAATAPNLSDASSEETDSETDWQTRFYQIYRLEDHQILKRIAPPFIPERLDYFVNEDPIQAAVGPEPNPPDTFFLHWDGEVLKNWGSGFMGGRGLSLEGVLRYILGLASFEYAGPEELLDLEIPGDWIVRPSASIEEKLSALTQISSQDLNRPFLFERSTVEREVLVTSGVFSLRPLEGQDPHELLMYLHKEQLDPNSPEYEEGGGGGLAESIDEFMRELGNRVGIPVQNEVSNDIGFELHYRHLSSTYLLKQKDANKKARQIKSLLENISEQTGLEFTITPQSVEIWQLAEKN